MISYSYILLCEPFIALMLLRRWRPDVCCEEAARSQHMEMYSYLFITNTKELAACVRGFISPRSAESQGTLGNSCTLIRLFLILRVTQHNFQSKSVSRSGVFVFYVEVPVSRVLCFPALPVPGGFLLCDCWPRPHCVTCVSFPDVQSPPPVYLNAACLIPFVLFSLCLTCFEEKITFSVERCWHLGPISLSPATTAILEI